MANAWREWSNYYWLVQKQAEGIQALGHPSYFLHDSTTGVFYRSSLSMAGSLGSHRISRGGLWVSLVRVHDHPCTRSLLRLWRYLLACETAENRRQVRASDCADHGVEPVLRDEYLRPGRVGRGDRQLRPAAEFWRRLSLCNQFSTRSVPILALLAGTALVAGSATSHCFGERSRDSPWSSFSVGTSGEAGLLASNRPLVLAGLIGVGVNFWFLLPDLAYARIPRVRRLRRGDRLLVVARPTARDPRSVSIRAFRSRGGQPGELHANTALPHDVGACRWGLCSFVVEGASSGGSGWAFGLNVALGSLLVVSQAWDVMPTS